MNNKVTYVPTDFTFDTPGIDTATIVNFKPLNTKLVETEVDNDPDDVVHVGIHNVGSIPLLVEKGAYIADLVY